MACTASVRTLGKRALRLALLSLIVSAAIINGAVTALAADGDDEIADADDDGLDEAPLAIDVPPPPIHPDDDLHAQ